MIKKPLTNSFDVVSMLDDALDSVPSELMRMYQSERDISVLDNAHEDWGWAGLAATQDKPTRGRCRPLRTQYQRLVGPDMDADDEWAIFAAHVERIEHLGDDDGEPLDVSTWWEGEGDKRRIHNNPVEGQKTPRELLPRALVTEWVSVIVHHGTMGGGAPFMPAVTWAQSRDTRAHARRVRKINSHVRGGKTASDTPTA